MNNLFNIRGGRDYIDRQVVKHVNIIHDLERSEQKTLLCLIEKSLPAVEVCWSGIKNKYYNDNNNITLNINNSNQYCQFLLILAKKASEEGFSNLADKIFMLNKMLNGCDIYHEVVLPECFYIDHSLSLVVGRAKLGENLFLSQGCTIGSNPGSPNYPSLGKNNFLMANSTIIGTVHSGDRVIFATGSIVKDIDIPSDSIVFGQTPNNIIKPLKEESFQKATPFK